MRHLFSICTLIPVFVIQCLCFPLNGYAKTNNAIIEESYQQEFKGTTINDSDGNYISVNNYYYGNKVAEEDCDINNKENNKLNVSASVNIDISDVFYFVFAFDYVSINRDKKNKKNDDEKDEDDSD